MKLISWNVNNRSDVFKQVEELSKREPDVVALQDVNVNALAEYERGFLSIGLPYVVHTYQGNSEHHPTGTLIASCFELERLPEMSISMLWPRGTSSPDINKVLRHWQRRTLFVTVKSTWGEIDLHNFYITPYYHREYIADGSFQLYPWIKFDLLSGVYQTVASHTNRVRILCGDFNTPQEEKPDGEIITWGYEADRNGSYVLTDPYQHDLEMNVLRGLSVYDLRDVYRDLHGYGNSGSDEECSWKTRRYDHIFASRALRPQLAEYLQAFRELHLSDHIPIEVVFEPMNVVKG